MPLKLFPFFLGLFLVIIYFFVSPAKIFAATLCWAGTGSGSGANWSVAGNWITTGGSVSGAAPGASDIATFDPSKTICTGGTPTNTNSTVNSTFAGTVGGVNIVSGFTQTITQSHDLVISGTTNGYTQASGTWDASGGSNNFTIDDSCSCGDSEPFTLSGGTFKASSGTIFFEPNGGSTWNTTGGTFTAGTGTVDFAGGPGQNNDTINGAATFNNLTFNSNHAWRVYILNDGTTKTVNGTLTISNIQSKFCQINGPGGISLKGDFSVLLDGCSGDAVITLSGTGIQTVTGGSVNPDPQAGNTQFLIPSLAIDSTGTVNFVNGIAPAGSFTYTAGTVNIGTSTVLFDNQSNVNTATITGNISFYNLEFYSIEASAYYAIASGSTITATNNLTFDRDTNGHICNITGPGTIVAQANISGGSIGCGGDVPLTLSGSANQTITGGGLDFPGVITFNKSGGTITLASDWTTEAGQGVTVKSGSTQTLTGAHTFNISARMNVDGTLTQGTTTISALGFIVSSTGVWSNTSTGGVTFGTSGFVNNGAVTFDGTAQGCGDADGITITTNGGEAEAWSGSGTFTIYDVNISHAHTSAPFTAYSSTDGGDNTGITFNSGCPVLPTATPTPTPISSNNSSSTPSTPSLPSPPSCTDSVPNQIPDLFQIDSAGTFVKLYFTPANGTGYQINFGLDQNANQFGDNFASQNTTGVMSRTIWWLNPNTNYYFRVRAANGCNAGNWSNTLSIKTKGRLADASGIFGQLFSKTPSAPINSQVLGTSISCNYQVQSGDSLWSIAESKWGTGIKYSNILSLNAEISADSILRINQILKLCN